MEFEFLNEVYRYIVELLLVGRVKVRDVCMYKSINKQFWRLCGDGGERWGNTVCGS